jgi:hypothetical protein
MTRTSSDKQSRPIRIRAERLREVLFAEELDSDRVERITSNLMLASKQGDRTGATRLMYLGGVVALAAVTVLIGEGWRSGGPLLGAFGASLVMTALFGVAEVLHRRGWKLPAGLAATVAIGLVPLVVFAFTQALGYKASSGFGEYHNFYAWISSQWTLMEIATIAVTGIALYRFRLPLLLLPAMVCSWFFSMDAASLIFGHDVTNNERLSLYVVVAAAMLGGGFALDHLGHRGHATWLHLGGLLTIGSVACFAGSFTWWALAALGVAGLSVGVVTGRNMYFVFGGIWTFSVASRLAFDTFGGNIAFPLTLLAGGAILVAAGMKLARRSNHSVG